MKTAAELYPDFVGRDSFYGPESYQPIIDDLGTVVLQVDDSDYQGDSRILYRDGERWGYLQFGWGSCSGCDALQACTGMGDIDGLIAGLRSSVKWYDTAGECLEYFNTHDWSGDYSAHAEEQADFIHRAKELLAAQ